MKPVGKKNQGNRPISCTKQTFLAGQIRNFILGANNRICRVERCHKYLQKERKQKSVIIDRLDNLTTKLCKFVIDHF